MRITNRLKMFRNRPPIIKFIWKLKTVIVFEQTNIARHATYFGIVFNGNNFIGFVKGGSQYSI